MDVLLLCGYFEDKYQNEIGQKTKTWVENAANTFQKRLINGLKQQKINLRVVSAPFIGPWPTVYKEIWFKQFEAGKSDENINYIAFNNIWGYRNISRTKALKKQVLSFLSESKSVNKAIIVYSPHTPFLEAAVYAKNVDKNVHIHMVVPDLPQYMNLSKNPHPIYDFFKKYDLKNFYKLNEQVDSYTLLTKYMAAQLNVDNRPYIIVEGISDSSLFEKPKDNIGKTIAYAGKLEEKFGVKRLIEAFVQIRDIDARLIICGGGELAEFVKENSSKDARITYMGLVPAEEARRILNSADVLVNPRLNNSEYTKYSFPSKNIEYLQTGNIVVGYMLDGIPSQYASFMIIPNGDSVEELKDALLKSIHSTTDEKNDRYKNTKEYITNHCDFTSVAKRILDLIAE